jgi:hypothetical protein
MNVQPIVMDTRIANIHYKDYRKKVLDHRAKRLAEAQAKIVEGGKTFRAGRTQRSLIEQEDEILMRSYRAIAQGMRIINVADVIRKGGFDFKQKLPLLAIGGADWKWAHLHSQRNRITFGESHWLEWDYNTGVFKQRTRGASYRNISFLNTGFPSEYTNEEWRKGNGLPRINGTPRALVPSIPPHLRPEGDLSEYQILWEAKWELTAPADPILLQHIAGNMYSVLAQWDMTPLEQQVLEGRIA